MGFFQDLKKDLYSMSLENESEKELKCTEKSLEDLLKEIEKNLLDESEKILEIKNTINIGEVIEGTVINVNQEEIIFNIGYRTNGIMIKSEYVNNLEFNFISFVRPGDRLKVKVIKKDYREGMVLLACEHSKKNQKQKIDLKRIKCDSCFQVCYINDNLLDKIMVCPFCSENIRAKASVTEIDSLGWVIYEAIDSFGINILTDPNKLHGYLLDIAPQLKREIRIYIKCVDKNNLHILT